MPDIADTRASPSSSPPHGGTRPARRLGPCRAALAVALAALATSCASIEFQQDTKTSGSFVSKGGAWTIFSIDLPKTAEQIARENLSDARLPNTRVTEIYRAPDLGTWDWLLDIIGYRHVRLTGTWGFRGE